MSPDAAQNAEFSMGQCIWEYDWNRKEIKEFWIREILFWSTEKLYSKNTTQNQIHSMILHNNKKRTLELVAILAKSLSRTN